MKKQNQDKPSSDNSEPNPKKKKFNLITSLEKPLRPEIIPKTRFKVTPERAKELREIIELASKKVELSKAQPSKSPQSESVEEAPSKNYINAYHEEESLRLKKEISQQQPISWEEFVKASKIANQSREQ